ncbi:sporulation protein YtxC [Carboxydothermus pertinax]|uniref:Sporulation protein YtxC n=1 Tax=Carboxydothermus pertinax TaxID=870242 RepID=A0A1L8CUT3_9THEO|nr:sporulation protein YtxC [Carboxydothermus pertinax]GAV22661.1 hypothetical protein cpu_11710 [Carboxydothermus pertinax]
MSEIIVGTSRYGREIETLFNLQLAEEIENGLLVMDKFQAGNFQFLALNIIKINSLSFTKESFLKKVSKVLTKVYVDFWEKDILVEVLRYEYPYFDSNEIENIKNKALKFLNIDREKEIRQKVDDFLHESQVINLDGFILFRLQREVNEIYDSIDRAVEEQILEKEYQEFIKIVKYFLELQPVKRKIVQVFWLNEYLVILDDQLKKVEDEFVEYLLTQRNKIFPEDLLISALISLAPEKIIIHWHDVSLNFNLKPIKDIFAERLEICERCEAFRC